MTATKIELPCPVCASPNDGHADVDGSDAAPSDGDLSICGYCGVLCWYKVTDGVYSLAEVSDTEKESLMKEPEIRKALGYVRLAQDGRSGER